ncbi:hypothetical protein ACLGIH_00640 [Streptomyces sp. HMX87]|uniref:hypothetical protein n=1 Tax=Streptomyces sp. HMX87 TaxID=3390849 RepID=UPI003A8ACB0F
MHGAAVRGLWLLGGWLVIAAAAVWCAEAAVARVRRSRQPTRQGETRTLHLYTAGILATAFLGELLLFIARLARGQDGVTAWAAGGLFLVLLGAASWRTANVSDRYGSASGHTPSDGILTIACFALSEACGAWLTARFAAEGPLWAAWALGGAMVPLAASFWLSDSQDRSPGIRYPMRFGAAGALGASGVVADFALRGETVAAWWASGVAVGVPLLLFGALSLSARRRRTVGHRGRTAPPGAQLAGILVPLASVAWAMSRGEPWSATDSDGGLLRVGWLAMAGAVLLLVQHGVLLWTGTGQPGGGTTEIARRVRGLALRERQQNWERRLRELDSTSHSVRTWWGRLAQPLGSAAVIELHRRTALTTGLAIDEVWPRIALVASDEVLRQVRRGERGVLVWRITVASALCTSCAWLLIGLTGFGGFRYTDWRPVPLFWGPLLMAVIALVQARRLLVEVNQAKADAIDVYRYDLAKRMHITLPPDPSGPYMIRLAGALSGDELAERPGWHRPPDLPDGTRLDELADLVALRLRSGVRAEVSQALRDRFAFAPQFPIGADVDLTALAGEVAGRTVGPVAEGLKGYLRGHLTELHRQVERDVQTAIHSSMKEAVAGPPLSNFVGYLAIELDRGQEDVRADSGVVTAPAGQRVKLFVSVVRDPRARDLPSVVESPPGRDFFVFEPVRVEGGRDTRTVSFDAMADSSTLTSLPQRRNLLVENERQTTFEFRLPEKEGGHEVWIQLYQAGHLVQVVALKVEVQAPAGAIGDA